MDMDQMRAGWVGLHVVLVFYAQAIQMWLDDQFVISGLAVS